MRAKMMTSRDAPEGERQKLVERSRSEMRAQITGMLTPEQNMKYEEILAESGDRGGARMRGGRIYALDENKQPKLLDVRFGLTDGTSTEVISPEVREGMEIITGSTQSQQGRTSQRPGGPRMF
jgi:HlyD family secretion protein